MARSFSAISNALPAPHATDRKDLVKERCKRLDRAPYVCNGCDKGHARYTIHHKYHYDVLFADRR